MKTVTAAISVGRLDAVLPYAAEEMREALTRAGGCVAVGDIDLTVWDVWYEYDALTRTECIRVHAMAPEPADIEVI